MQTAQVTAGLAELPPGPELAAALALIDLAEVPNGEIITVLQAWSRMRAHVDARFLASVAEVGRRDPMAELDEVARLAEPARYAPDETRVALAWTRRAAEAEHDLAEILTAQLPSVLDALRAGQIDRPKARAFADHLADLPAALIDTICRALLPKAPALTTGILRARLAKHVIAADPDRAHHHYRKAVRKRTVIGYLNPDGTATVTAEGLPPDQAAAACARITSLARAAKRAGHRTRLDQIRADVFLGLLDGRYHHLTRDEIITRLLHTDTDTRAAQTKAEDPSDGQPGADETPAGGTDGGDTDAGAAQGVGVAARGLPTGIEVRLELATLLGRNQHPGELPGWGPITAQTAREIVARQRRAEWRFAITDHHGQLLHGGLTRRRPHGVADGSLGGVVEVHIPATLLGRLAANPPPGWASVITDIVDQHASWPRQQHILNGRPGRRLPIAGLRRHTQIRDRTCRGPGCRHPAALSQFDHTRDYRHGGTTTEANGGQVCGHDHDLKTKGGWTLEQPHPGVFLWHTPLGQTHRTRGEPIITPLPEPEEDPDPPPF